jgi:competence protein ComEA
MKRFIALLLVWLASLGVAFAAVNVNTANRGELEALKGIGPVKAQAIIDYRQKNGPFRSLEDLDKVPGIGKATLNMIKDDVTFSGANTGVAKAEARKEAAARETAKAAEPPKETVKEKVQAAGEKVKEKVQAAGEKVKEKTQSTKEAARDKTATAKDEAKDKTRVAKREEASAAVDINSASERELEALPGVGAARAKQIVKGRPYRSKNELVDKHILPQNVYDGLKDRVVARRGS